MPTGYTARMADGITFNQFILGCARAFGALITMRDDSNDTPIPDKFEPSDYHSKEIVKARKELNRLMEMTGAEAETFASQTYVDAEKHRKKAIKKNDELQGKYEAMLEKVKAWIPPSSDHRGLKDFMIRQITESIKFDCSSDYYKTPTIKLSGIQWRTEQINKAKRDIEYHERRNTEEIELISGRNKWVKDLRESIK